MKKFVSVIVLLLTAGISFAQQNTELRRNPCQWPIAGAEAGTGIICAPQGYIEGEFNFDNLFIGAEEGAEVVAPADGVITFVSTGYLTDLCHSTSYHSDKTTFDEQKEDIKTRINKSMDPKYLCGHIGINIGNGRMIWINGLSGNETLKEGQRIKKGDPIGRVAYSYHKIKRPSISIGISLNGKPDDPMMPFGIMSSFIPPKIAPPVTAVTNKQAREDFLLYIEALKELFPGLYEIITPEELERYIAETVARIDAHKGKWPVEELRNLMQKAVAKVHDSHIHMSPPAKTANNQADSVPYLPQIRFGWIGGTLVCTNAFKTYEHLIGKPISSVNGMTADSMKAAVLPYIGGYDRNAAEYVNYILAKEADIFLLSHKPWGDGSCNMNVEFTDGQTINLKGYDTKAGYPSRVYGQEFFSINRWKDSYGTKILNESTAYIGFNDISLYQTQWEEIAAFIRSIADKENLIIDLRNTLGGWADATEKVYSYIASNPVAVSTNYPGMTDLSDQFAAFEPVEGKEGLYDRSAEGRLIVPDPVTNYKGKVYVLVNEKSGSAATLFPALVIKEGRGVVIGRETNSGYHHMTAEKFADTRLPNSDLRIKIPLVELGFDTVVTERIPYGRGVIPDHIIPLTLNELNYRNGDAILNYTLDLITKNGGESAKNQKGVSPLGIFLIISGILIAARFLYFITGNRAVFGKLRRKKRNVTTKRETDTGRPV